VQDVRGGRIINDPPHDRRQRDASVPVLSMVESERMSKFMGERESTAIRFLNLKIGPGHHPATPNDRRAPMTRRRSRAFALPVDICGRLFRSARPPSPVQIRTAPPAFALLRMACAPTRRATAWQASPSWRRLSRRSQARMTILRSLAKADVRLADSTLSERSCAPRVEGFKSGRRLQKSPASGENFSGP